VTVAYAFSRPSSLSTRSSCARVTSTGDSFLDLIRPDSSVTVLK
jgi:hypothetical protein